VERFDGLKAPGLAFLAFGFGPANRLPVRSQNQARSGVGDFHAVAAGLIHVQEEGLLDGVFVRAGLDVDAIFEAVVRGDQHLFAAVDRVCDVMETTP